MKNLLAIFALLILASLAGAQSPDQGQLPRKWLECDVTWMLPGEDEVGSDFALQIVFDDHPLSGAQIELAQDHKVFATARTDSHGLAHFTAIPPGQYSPRPAGGLEFPHTDQIVKVVGKHRPGETVKSWWPASSVSVRALSGRLTTSDKESPTSLRGAKVELLDLRTGRLIETAITDADGAYNFAETRRGLYDMRVTPPVPLEPAKILSREIAVQLDAAGEHGMIPEFKVLQSECAGVQLFQRTLSGNWEAQ